MFLSSLMNLSGVEFSEDLVKSFPGVEVTSIDIAGELISKLKDKHRDNKNLICKWV